MRLITEYLSVNIKPNIIHATDDNIKRIVREELERLGHDADLNHIDVSNVKKMTGIFEPIYIYQQHYNPDISHWNVSKAEDMRYMFNGCEDFNCDISDWNVSKVKDMSGMFFGCKNFNKDISKWNVSNVENMNQMFFNCKSFNQDLSNWNVLKASRHIIQVFDNCPIKEEFKPHFIK